MIILQKLEKIYRKIAKTGVTKILITIPLALETMQQLVIKPWRRSLEPCCRKTEKKFKRFKNLEKIADLNADI